MKEDMPRRNPRRTCGFRICAVEFRPLIPLLFLGACFASGLYAQDRKPARAAAGAEFFIISSVDSNKQQLVLKRPTEVTLLVRVDEKTVYLDEKSKRVQLKDFRAGDTVYVVLRSSVEGSPTIATIQKGLMTPEELRRRYLKAPAGEGQ